MTEYIEVSGMVAEVRHAPGMVDDGMVLLWGPGHVQPIPPEVGISGRKGTWPTVHPVYYRVDNDN